jgi:monovalent cation:proton antiporter-2 (CPA2) family protein
MNIIAQATVFLAAAILIVPIFRRLGLGDVLGFLCAGLLIGPSALGVIDDPDNVLHFAELGVVFLLFIIGLELQPARLWVFRHLMFGLGSLQVLVTMMVFAWIARLVGFDWSAAITIGAALSLSSTAFVLQLMGEQKELLLPHGRAAFGVLLLQDMAVIPLLALIGMLSADEAFVFDSEQVVDMLRLIGTLVVALIACRYILRYLLRFVVSLRHPELFLATALFTVVGTGLLFENIGLSMGLGAFAAGVLLADSEFRHQLQADIVPFKGLLLGLFFMAVGMSADIGVLIANWQGVIFVAFLLVVGKWLLLLPLGYLFGLRDTGPRRFGILLAQGGEFAFVMLTPALNLGLIDSTTYDILVLGVTLSMFCTPFLFLAEYRWRQSRNLAEDERPYDTIPDQDPKVVVAGFGRFGQIIARVLHARGVPFVAIDADPEQVEFVRRYGNKVYYGDVSRFDVLRAAGIEKAEVFVCAIGDPEVSLRVARHLRREFPRLKVYARARNRQHAIALRAVGAQVIMRDTLLSSLQIAESVLTGLGFSDEDAEATVRIFKDHDEELLDRQYAVRDDEEAVFKHAKSAAEQLKYLFEEDTK